MPNSGNKVLGLPIEGVIGNDFLGGYQVCFDLRRKKLWMRRSPSKVDENALGAFMGQVSGAAYDLAWPPMEPVTIRLTRSREGYFTTDVQIGGVTLTAAFDTGASGLMLGSDRKGRLPLDKIKTSAMPTYTGLHQGDLVMARSVAVGGVPVSPQPIFASKQLPAIPKDLEAFVGPSCFPASVVVADFAHGLVTIDTYEGDRSTIPSRLLPYPIVCRNNMVWMEAYVFDGPTPFVMGGPSNAEAPVMRMYDTDGTFRDVKGVRGVRVVEIGQAPIADIVRDARLARGGDDAAYQRLLAMHRAQLTFPTCTVLLSGKRRLLKLSGPASH
jgi:hypothetical protein